MLMKSTWLVAALIGAALPVLAELAEPQAAERGPHHTVWQNVEDIIQASGDVTTQIHSYVELAAGLNYLSNGKWVEAVRLLKYSPKGQLLAKARIR